MNKPVNISVDESSILELGRLKVRSEESKGKGVNSTEMRTL
jgi:hypothetical protein